MKLLSTPELNKIIELVEKEMKHLEMTQEDEKTLLKNLILLDEIEQEINTQLKQLEKEI